MRALGLVLILSGVAAAQDAAKRVQAAEKRIRSRKSGDLALIEALRSLVAVERELPGDQARLRKRIAHAVLDLLHKRREKVQWEAALALGRLHPSAFRVARRAIARGLLEEDEPSSVRVWEATCSSLLRLDLDEGAAFLIEEVIDPNTDEARWRRTRAALLALAAAPRPSARVRHEALKDLLARFQSYPFHVEEPLDWVAGFRGVRRSFKRTLQTHGWYWADMRPRVQRVMLRLSADPVTGALPRDVDDNTQIETLERLKVWNGKHKNRKRSPWIDPAGKPLPRTTLREFREPGRALYRRFAAPWTVYWPLLAPPMPRQEDPLAPRRAELRRKILGAVMRNGLDDSDWRVRGMAAIGLGRLGGGGEELWAALDAEREERAREAIAYGLLLARDKGSRDRWRSRADDASENPQVRALALLALALLGEIDDLRKRNPKEPELLGCTLAAIGLAGDRADSHRLIGVVLANRCAPGVRGAAAAALVRVGDPGDCALLLDGLRRATGPVRRAALAHALGGVVRPTDRKPIRALAKLFLQPSGTFGGDRVEAALALARVGGADASALLRKGAEACRRDTRRSAEYGTMLLALSTTDAPALMPHFEKAQHEWDAAAAALALARAGIRSNVDAIRGRLAESQRIYIPSAIEALGRLNDAASSAVIVQQLEHAPRDRAVATGAVALARLRGSKARLLGAWRRAEDRAEFAGLVEAFGIVGPAGEEQELLRIATEGRAKERAFALGALAAMASPSDSVARRIRAAFFVYDAPRTITRLARFGDTFFLAESDE